MPAVPSRSAATLLRRWSLAAVSLAITATASVVSAAPSPKPHVILFLADDQGWTGTSVAMDPAIVDSSSDFYETPRLEQLAAEGMRFSEAYAPSPVCVPTRWSIQTGRIPAALQQAQGPGLLPLEATTLAEALKAADPDYVTAHLGKWHLGSDPGSHGYDVHDGDTSNGDGDTMDPENPKDIFGITSRALSFMAEQVATGNPFYLQISHYAVHAPLTALADTRAKYQGKLTGERHTSVDYAAMTEDLDTALGIVLDAVEALGIADRTYVVYTSDNGASQRRSNNLPLAGGKTLLWEGGVRVPFIVRGPGIEAGTVSDAPVIGWDLLPTVLAWIGAPPEAIPAEVEGGSLKRTLERGGFGSVARPQADFIWHFPRHICDGTLRPHSAIRERRHKAIHFYDTGEQRLYDLRTDPGELHDLLLEKPELATELFASLQSYLDAVGADPPPATCDGTDRCGLGFELAFLLPVLIGLHRRRSKPDQQTP